MSPPFFLIKMHVRFVIRKTAINSQGLCPMECRIRISGIEGPRFSVHVMVDPDKWDSKAQRIKGASEKVNADNRKLNQVKYELEQLHNIALAKGSKITAKDLIDYYLGKREFGCMLTSLFKKKIEDLESKNRSPRTIEIHERGHKYLLEFLGQDRQSHEITKNHVKGFWGYLKKKGYTQDYTNKTVSNVKSLFIFGEKEGYVDVNPFKTISFEWENKVDLTRLEEWEMEALKTKEWSPKLQKVVDSFLFMCYQGLHIADYKKMASDNIVYEDRIRWVRVGRTKTKVEALVPLHSIAHAIIKKYGHVANLPKLSGKTSNEHLKVIAEYIGTKKNLTNKIARKTFTDMCINVYGMSDESVAAMLGHTSTRFVKKYGSVRKARILAEWKDRIEEPEEIAESVLD